MIYQIFNSIILLMHNSSPDYIVEKINEALKRDSETSKVEFKSGGGGLGNKVHRPISSFSNTAGGGIVVFGVVEHEAKRPRFEIVGVPDIHGLQEKIYNFMETEISNPGEFSIESIDMQGKTLVVLGITEARLENKPCFYTKLGMNKGTFLRVGSANRLASEEEIRTFIKYSPEYKIDQMPVMQIGIESLDNAKVDSYLLSSAERSGRTYEKGADITAVLKNIKLAVDTPEGIRPTVAGLMLFSKRPPQDFSGLDRYVVRCVRYADKTPASAIIDQANVGGTLDHQVDASLAFIQ